MSTEDDSFFCYYTHHTWTSRRRCKVSLLDKLSIVAKRVPSFTSESAFTWNICAHVCNVDEAFATSPCGYSLWLALSKVLQLNGLKLET
jgi:hypothetical protein